MKRSADGDATGLALVLLAERVYAVERPRKVLFGLITALLLALSTALVYHTGGTYLPYLHIFYLPIITANFLLGPGAGAAAAVVAGALVGWVPLNVEEGTAQAPSMIVFRTVFFVVVSLAAGLVSRLARVHIDSLREKVSEKTAELEKSYQELKDLQEARDFLTNTIIHDLRSSLTSTILSCEVLDRKYDDVLKDDGKVLMDTALSSAKRMHVMVSNILDVYAADRKALEPKREPWEVEAALRQAAADFQLQATLRKISLCVEAPGELPPVEADGELMRRVLANLLYNAVGYTPAGGAVVLGASRRGGAVEVAVSNTGSYIAPEWHQKIFEKFARLESGSAARSGSGLGLAFCRMAVEAHGGKIWVASARDGDECSTTFRFTVPAAPEG